MVSSDDYPHLELTHRIIGAAYAIHTRLGPGHREKVYENALCAELRRHSISVEQQKPVPITDLGEEVGEFVPDLIVEQKVIIEVKARKTLTADFESRLLSYLKSSKYEVGLLLNFSESVEVKRKVHTKKTLEIRNPGKQNPSPPSA